MITEICKNNFIDAHTKCWNCNQEISSIDSYCKYCGKGQGKNISWQYKPWGIIFLTVCALGPFTIKYVWKTPQLSKRAKIIYTFLIIAITIYFFNKLYTSVNEYYALALQLIPQ
ncbi:MAG TPA: hypothetical protein DF296_04615 [Candidatus Margulisbacteria bacterium]|nr:MAG: hypothetical protein A2X43_10655 [Candidatus Margulisbacteria bacterium GWD2_39_127]HCT84466.1 hypothetical protein [Candidatus Margulisiibacteriota bacterium]